MAVKANSPIREHGREAGIALLISIFVLLLISVVAIALIVSSGTESSLAGNYRSATGVYYAALGGLEEARGRLPSKDPNSFNNTAPGFLPSPGNTLAIGAVAYVLNPGPTEAMGNILTTYPDAEYDNEFGSGALAAAVVTTTAAVWNRNPLNALPFPAPLYKWVRINAVSEKSLKTNFDGYPDSTTEVYYDGAHLNNSSSAGPQVLEITSLAVLPNGSQKIVQYLIAPVPLNLSFPAALTLDGQNVQFSIPMASNIFYIDGTDHDTVGSCNPVATPVWAVGYTNADLSSSNILTAIPPGPPPPSGRGDHYIGRGATTPNVPPSPVTVSANLQTVGGLKKLVQDITQVADAVVNPTPVDATGLGTAHASDLPSAMGPSNPVTTVVNGNLDVSGWTGTGYGLLLVTGEFKYDPSASWKGIVLVIGVGKLSSYNPGGGAGDLDGVVFLAKITDTTTSPYSQMPPGAPGVPNFAFTGSGSEGIYYSKCWVDASMPTPPYKILSFHEISQ